MSRRYHAAGLLLCLALAHPASAFDLHSAKVETLDNGLMVALLEDHTFPVVSVQMLYKVGARNEEMGRTGLAHFLEHMAFRDSESFPDSEVVSSIYGVGGEWHGYTWIDQTVYFATVPREHLELVLRIEADRMQHLLILAEHVEAEKGAVLSELHGYENDPAAVLLDTVVASSFQQHPYRFNTIGWESDVERIEHADLLDFYRAHYHPANAVLAVVGDIETGEVRELVRQHFGATQAGSATPPVRTIEPPQRGQRRVEIQGQGGDKRFTIAYRAPSVRSPDWPVFLVLQEILGGGEGVNFLQNEWGVPVRPESRLAGITEDLTTWYPASFDPYLFVLSGTIPADASPQMTERQIEERLESVRRQRVEPEDLAGARARVLESLVFDVQTTEDAAHQLACYAGYGALAEILELSAAIGNVTAARVHEVAANYLDPRLGTVGWYLPAESMSAAIQAPTGSPTGGNVPETPAKGEQTIQKRSGARGLDKPVVTRLSGGLPVLFQRVSPTPTAYMRVVVPSTVLAFSTEAIRDWPIWRHTSLNRRFMATELETVVAEMYAAWEMAEPGQSIEPADLEDPGQRLEAGFMELLVGLSDPNDRLPAAIVLVGDLEIHTALEALERHFGNVHPAAIGSTRPLALRSRELAVQLPVPKAQARLGYLVPAPVLSHDDSLAWRLLLYVLTHGYEGRLGKEAIGRRGLIYYIDSSYRSDDGSAAITLSIGVDPVKLPEMHHLLVESLKDLEDSPPSEAELNEARQHFIGRWRSAAQSNEEISAALATEWIGHGRLRPETEFVEAVAGVTRQDVLQAIPEFVSGAIVVVESPASSASLIVTGGPILTLDSEVPAAEAVAIADGRILGIGSRDEIDRYRGPATENLDLAGRLLLPGFIDHHVHLLNMGMSLLWEEELPIYVADISAATSPEAIAERVAERAAELPPGSWVVGKGWNQGAWGTGVLPDHGALSARIPEHPVFLTRADGHAGWLNARAMQEAGIDAATPDPVAGLIRRRPSGEPTGVLLERANERVTKQLPSPSDEQIMAAFRRATLALAEQGVTEVFDAGFLAVPGIVDLNLDLERYLELLVRTDRNQPLPVRVNLMVPAPSELASRIIEDPAFDFQLSPRLRVTHLKLFMDGALGSRGALLSHPYADDPSTHGVRRMTPSELRDAAIAGLKRGLDIATHAIGDRAVADTLDVYEELLQSSPEVLPSRLRLEHFSYARMEDFERAARLGVVLSVQPNFVYPGNDGTAMEDARVGLANSERVYAWGRLNDLGASLAFGSDYFTRPLASLYTVYAAATRKNAAGLPAKGWHPGDRVPRLEALQWATTLQPPGGADAVSGLTPGRSADFVILSADPLVVEEDEILGIEVEATFMAGSPVFQRSAER